ncbi:MAG: adenylate/guanylate cyclase domain-containing protein [Polyangia bacterium]|jgi:adenylate cyclase|nr:adenylate/guanylate cyclase domain-containing protein [Polyangia bacterium]
MRFLRTHLTPAAGVLATICFALVFVLQATQFLRWPLLDRLEAWSLDARFRVRGTRPPKDDRLLIVGLDDRVRAEAPKLNQERRQFARLLERIAAGKPRVIAVDYIFDTPEEMLPRELALWLARQRGELDAALGKEGLGQELRDTLGRTRDLVDALLEHTRGDERLAETFRRAGQVVLAVLFRFAGEGGGEAPVGELGRAAYSEAVLPEGLPARRLPPHARGAAGITQALSEAAAAAGFVNNIVEDDGATRRAYTAIRYRGQVYVPLSMQALRHYLGIPRGEVSFVAGRREVALGPHRLPLDSRGRVLVNFLGPGGTFPTVSAADVLSGKVPASRFRDRIVLVGPNDAANIDKAITPFDPLLPGVELHATIIHNLLHGEALREASWLWGLLLLLLLGLATSLLHGLPFKRRALFIGSGTVLILALPMTTGLLLFLTSGISLAIVAPLLSVLGVTLVCLGTGYLSEGREKRRIRTLFQHYLHADVIRELTEDPGKLRLGGERRDVTVLFSDIRGFSRLSEQLDPQRLALLVNQYLTPMTDAVLDERGYLDKYIGDAIMALFGAPKPREDHAVLAARTAFAMLERLERLNRQWASEAFAPVRIGIGLNSGEVSLGNFGSERRIEYTAMGDTVNLASRLEGLNKAYGTTVLAGEATWRALEQEFWGRELDLVRVKGKDVVARIYEILGPRAEGRPCPLDISVWREGLEAYRAADWVRAREAFQRVLGACPEGRPDRPSQVFLERVSRLSAEGVTAETWDGVWVMESK